MSTINSLPTTELASGPIDLTVVEPDGHYEVVNGKVVEKPAMGVFETWFASELFGWLQRSPGIQEHGRVLSEMLFLLDAANDLKRRPDLAFVSHERWARNRPVPRTAAWEVIPDLAIEIISPTNLACEVLVRVDDYFRCWGQVGLGRLSGRGAGAGLRLRISHQRPDSDPFRPARIAGHSAWLSAPAGQPF